MRQTNVEQLLPVFQDFIGEFKYVELTEEIEDCFMQLQASISKQALTDPDIINNVLDSFFLENNNPGNLADEFNVPVEVINEVIRVNSKNYWVEKD